MPRPLARSAVFSLCLVLALAACQSGGGSPSPTSTPAAATAATEAPASTDDTGLDSFPAPSFGVDPVLQKMLPTTLGGVPVQTIGMSGDDFAGSGLPGSEELQALLTTVGKSMSDVSIAFAATDAVTIMAFRVKGLQAALVVPGFVAGIQQSGELGTVTVKDVTLGGKGVKELDPSDGSAPSYVYASGEVIFFVGGDALTPALLTEVFSKLP